MAKERFKITPAAYLIIIKDKKILMSKRLNTGYEDGNYSLVAGHLDGGETFRQAMAREAKEETDLDINPAKTKVVHIMHRYEKNNNPEIRERIDVFVQTDQYFGVPKIMEPDKCDDISWFGLDNLPPNTIPYVKYAIKCILNNITYSEFGFDD
ncbi:MAG: NUDIX domain-containing protein [Candidatus Buchananbacteria bacterium]|nr:NUDIX domain-containing protein [Candidatus Buchananbacteria bacterium]